MSKRKLKKLTNQLIIAQFIEAVGRKSVWPTVEDYVSNEVFGRDVVELKDKQYKKLKARVDHVTDVMYNWLKLSITLNDEEVD